MEPDGRLAAFRSLLGPQRGARSRLFLRRDRRYVRLPRLSGLRDFGRLSVERKGSLSGRGRAVRSSGGSTPPGVSCLPGASRFRHRVGRFRRPALGGRPSDRVRRGGRMRLAVSAVGRVRVRRSSAQAGAAPSSRPDFPADPFRRRDRIAHDRLLGTVFGAGTAARLRGRTGRRC